MSILERAWQAANFIFQGSFQPNVSWDMQNKTVVVNPNAVTQDSALSIGALYRIVNILSNSVQQMDIETWRGTTLLNNPSFISRPDINMPASHFIEMSVTSLAMSGNAYWLVSRNSAGTVNNLEVVNPNLVTVEVDERGRRRWSYDSKYYYEKDIQHLKLTRIPGYEYGIGPIQQVRGELELALDLRDYQGVWFQTAGAPTGILKSDQFLSPEMADAYKQRWVESMSDPLNKTAVLGSGLSYQSTYLSPKDALFVDVANFNLQQVARMYGVPLAMLDIPLEGSSMTYQNVQDAIASFLKFTLVGYMNEIENAFSELLPRGQVARFNTSALLRLDQASRYQNHAIALQNGWVSADEVRKMEGLQGPAPEPKVKELLPPKSTGSLKEKNR